MSVGAIVSQPPCVEVSSTDIDRGQADERKEILERGLLLR